MIGEPLKLVCQMKNKGVGTALNFLPFQNGFVKERKNINLLEMTREIGASE